MGRPGAKSKYRPKIHPKLVEWMLRAGLTIENICSHPDFNISRQTFYRWCKKFPEMQSALDSGGRDYADFMVENALFKRAVGYSYTERKLKYERDVHGNRKLIGEEYKTKDVPPDVGAMVFWLKNRKPDTWRDKPAEGDSGDDSIQDAVKALGEAIKQTH